MRRKPTFSFAPAIALAALLAAASANATDMEPLVERFRAADRARHIWTSSAPHEARVAAWNVLYLAENRENRGTGTFSGG